MLGFGAGHYSHFYGFRLRFGPMRHLYENNAYGRSNVSLALIAVFVSSQMYIYKRYSYGFTKMIP
jgi:hypothetical protein